MPFQRGGRFNEGGGQKVAIRHNQDGASLLNFIISLVSGLLFVGLLAYALYAIASFANLLFVVRMVVSIASVVAMVGVFFLVVLVSYAGAVWLVMLCLQGLDALRRWPSRVRKMAQNVSK